LFDSFQLKEGDPAPELKLKDQDGNLVFLRDFREKNWVLLYFYPKDDTPGCTVEACSLRDALEDLTRAGVQLLGVSTDTGESHQRFARKYRLNFPLLSDPKRKVARAYGALAFYRLARRMTFLIDPQGIIRRIFPKVNPRMHAEEIRKVLMELHVL
jgi:thioredoxin-dependent peroxiredoxin